jgi:hypothetical protein
MNGVKKTMFWQQCSKPQERVDAEFAEQLT